MSLRAYAPPSSSGSVSSGFAPFSTTLYASTVTVGNLIIPAGIVMPYAGKPANYRPRLTQAPTGQAISVDVVAQILAPAAPTLVGGYGKAAFTATSGVQATLPAGANADGMLGLIVTHQQNVVTGGLPASGWTSKYDESGLASGAPAYGRQTLWWRKMTGADSLAVPFSAFSGAPGSSTWQTLAVAGANVDAADPFDAFSTNPLATFEAAGAAFAFGTITPTLPNALLLGILGEEGNPWGTTTWTNLSKLSDDGFASSVGLSLATAVQATPVASPAISASQSDANNLQGKLLSIAPKAWTKLQTLTIPAGTVDVEIPATHADLPAGTVLNFNVTAVGSTIPGSGLAVDAA